MNAVIYARYSSDRQTEQSIDGQLRECKEFAASEGITIVGEYIDRAISGTTDHRPDFQRMIDDSKYGEFDAVIVYKLDRFARNRYDSAVYKSKLKQNGVRVLSAKERITDSPEGIILEGLLESMNEYYSAELSQKIKRGMRENVLKGKTTGGNIALGYKIGKDKRFEIDENGAAIVRRIFTEYDQGKTFAEICRDLNNAGYTTSRGKPYRNSTLTRILANRKYIGEYIVDGVSEASECPKIVDKDLFERVQQKLDAHKSKHRHRRSEHTYLLTGKLLCAECEKPISGTGGTSRTGTRYFYYKCPCGCSGRINAENLENTVVETVEKFLTRENCDMISKAAYDLYQKERKENNELKAAQNELKDVSKKLENAVNAILSGINSQTLQDTMQELERRKTALEAEIKRLSMSSPDFKLEHFQYFMRKFSDFKKSDDDKQHMIDTIVNRVIVYPNQIVVLVNVTDKTKTPPLQQITAALEECSCNVSFGGRNATQSEPVYIFVTPFIIALSLRYNTKTE